VKRCDVDGCEQWVFDGGDGCYFHQKVRNGLIVLEGKKKPGRPAEPNHGPEKAPLGTEAFETEELARQLGVSVDVGRQAISRRSRASAAR
jgi:hypothetical protein